MLWMKSIIVVAALLLAQSAKANDKGEATIGTELEAIAKYHMGAVECGSCPTNDMGNGAWFDAMTQAINNPSLNLQTGDGDIIVVFNPSEAEQTQYNTVAYQFDAWGTPHRMSPDEHPYNTDDGGGGGGGDPPPSSPGPGPGPIGGGGWDFTCWMGSIQVDCGTGQPTAIGDQTE